MKEDKLQKLLAELQEALNELDGRDHAAAEELSALKKQVDRSLVELDETNTEVLDHETLSQRLTIVLDAFESSHPNLTAVVADILNALSPYRI